MLKKDRPLQNFKAKWHQSVDFLLPPRCPLCDVRVGEHYALCGACFYELAFVSDPKCGQCGIPFEAGVAIGDTLCGDCVAAPPPFDVAVSPLLYDDASRRAILKLKHGEALELAPWLAKTMARAIKENNQRYDMVIPVPLHPRRLWKRGFNQSAELARHLAKHLDAKLSTGLLIRTKNTPTQGGLSRKARYRNLAGAFQVSAKGQANLAGLSVLLVDDVLTTGATIRACSRKLRQYRPRTIGVVTAARVHSRKYDDLNNLFTDH